MTRLQSRQIGGVAAEKLPEGSTESKVHSHPEGFVSNDTGTFPEGSDDHGHSYGVSAFSKEDRSTQVRHRHKGGLHVRLQSSDGVRSGERAVQTQDAHATEEGCCQCWIRPGALVFPLITRWKYVWEALFVETVLGLAVLLVARFVVVAPSRLPYLHDALLTAFCYLHFQGLLVYVTWKQLLSCGSAEKW
jgi:hypothetical protein